MPIKMELTEQELKIMRTAIACTLGSIHRVTEWDDFAKQLQTKLEAAQIQEANKGFTVFAAGSALVYTCVECGKDVPLGTKCQNHPAPAPTTKCKGCGEEAVCEDAYCVDCRTAVVSHGYTRAELSEAFDSVKNAENWKNPIEKFLSPVPSANDVQKIHYAIEFYAGGGAKFQHLGPHKLRVTAPGYYKLIGA